MFARRVAHLLFLLLRYQACPSLIVVQSGGGDDFLFRPSKIPFLNVVRRWSPFGFGIGFGHLELNFTYNFYITVLCFLYSIIYLYMFAI